MNSQEKRHYQELLASLHQGERQKLYMRAKQLRARDMPRKGHVPPLEDFVLRLLMEEAATDDSADMDATEQRGQVVGIAAGRVTVTVDGQELDIPLAPELARQQQSAVAVGDMVCLDDTPRVATVLPRRTWLSRVRAGATYRERVLAANIDTVVLVVAVKTPPLRPRLLDRALLAVAQGGASPLIAVTKIDLLSPEERQQELARLQPYRAMDIPIIPCSSLTGEGLPALRLALAGKTCVCVGHSGVGKSSLLNALDPALSLVTNDLRKGDHKGRHTTTASRLYRLTEDIRLIDTPGVREFGLWQMGAEEIRACFHEFTDHAAACAFSDCTHTHEPRCGVKEAVRRGDIARARYASYLRLLGDTDDQPGEMMAEAAFTCAHCGEMVPGDGAGSDHRNHCPRCLWSLHLDDRPGDRAAGCGGEMEPVAVWVRKGGEWAIIHRCHACGMLHSNRIAADDNEALLLSLAVRPLAQPAFRLDTMG